MKVWGAEALRETIRPVLLPLDAMGDSPVEAPVQGLPVAVYRCDAAGRILSFNDAAVHLWGRRPELEKDRWSDFWRLYDLDGEPIPAEQCSLVSTARKARPREGAAMLVERADGSRCQVVPQAQALFDAQGKPCGAVHVLVDITAREHAERELLEALSRLEGFVEGTNDGVITRAMDGTITSWNRAAEALFGYTAGEIVGQPAAVIMPAERLAEDRAAVEQVRRGKRIQRLDTVRRCKGGRLLEVALTLVPIRDARGKVASVTEILHDLSEQREAEHQGHEQSHLLDLASDAIMVSDFETDRILYWNQGAERVYGWTAEEALESSMANLLGLDPAMVLAIREATLARNEWRGELRETSRDGREVVVNARMTLVRDEDGKPVSLQSVHTDITRQKELEVQFLRAQRLDSVGTLASGVAHDLNNILSPIIMSVPVLEADLKPDVRAKILHTILASARRGAEIVKQVLTYARGVESRRIPVNCLRLVDEVVVMARETFPKSIKILSHCAKQLWPTLGDPTQLHQVLINLLVNGRDAMTGGGTLTITVKNFPVDESFASMVPEAHPGRYVLLQVSDTGSGIPKGILDKIFDPFFTTKEAGKGTGLGLSTVLGIVKNHGGFLTVESEVKRGATFKVFLPTVIQEGEEAEMEAQIEGPPGNGELILLADDEESIRVVTGAMLETAGYKVLLAADGTEAIALYAQRLDQIQAVITDAAMPYLNGASLTRALRKLNAEVRVIGTSGHGNDTDAIELRQLTPDAFVEKPYDKASLLQTIHQVLHA